MLEKEDLKQIENVFNQALGSRLETILDTKFDEKLEPIKQTLESRLETILDAKFDEKLEPIKQRLDSIEIEIREIKVELAKIYKLEGEDIGAAYQDVDSLRKRVDVLEQQVKDMQSAHI